MRLSSLNISGFILAALLSSSAHAGLFSPKTAPPPEDAETMVLVQVYLDEMLLGPGKIDGRIGEFTKNAVALYNQRYKLEPDNWHRVMRDANRRVRTAYASYTVPPEALDFVGSVPATPAEQQHVRYLSYRRVSEFVAERFHTDEQFLRELNSQMDLYALRPGQTVIVPNVTPFRIETIAKHQKFEAAPGLSERLAYVDTKKRIVNIFDKGKLVASFPITPGHEQFIPYGDWKVQIMVTMPEFRWDDKMLKEGERSDDTEAFQLPPGPNSPVGIFWAGLNKSGIGLHGTSSPETIGRSRSAGCIRLANWDAIRLSDLMRPGATVLVR